MRSTNDFRREALRYRFAHILHDFRGGSLDSEKAKIAMRNIFKQPNFGWLFKDVEAYADRTVVGGEMRDDETLENLVNMEMSFDSGYVYT